MSSSPSAASSTRSRTVPSGAVLQRPPLQWSLTRRLLQERTERPSPPVLASSSHGGGVPHKPCSERPLAWSMQRPARPMKARSMPRVRESPAGVQLVLPPSDASRSEGNCDGGC